MPRTRRNSREPFTNVQYLDIIVWYNTVRNLRETQRRFRIRYPNVTPPSLGRILRITQNMLDFGSVHVRTRPGWWKTAGTPTAHVPHGTAIFLRKSSGQHQTGSQAVQCEPVLHMEVSKHVWDVSLSFSARARYHARRLSSAETIL